MQASYKLSGDFKKITLGLSVGDYLPFIVIGRARLTTEDIAALLETSAGGARDLINGHLEEGSGLKELNLTEHMAIHFGWKNNEPVIKIASRARPQERCHLDYAEWNTLCLTEFCITAHLNRLIRCKVNAQAYIERLFNALFVREMEKKFEDTCDRHPSHVFYSDCCIVMKKLCTKVLDCDEYLFLSEMVLYHFKFLYTLYKKTPIHHYRR